jgi:hypothetical protein
VRRRRQRTGVPAGNLQHRLWAGHNTITIFSPTCEPFFSYPRSMNPLTTLKLSRKRTMIMCKALALGTT